MNIFSGEQGLGAALTNPTELARAKGGIACGYPVRIAGRLFPDAESAYQFHKTDDPADNDVLMARVIAAKFRQHPELLEAVRTRGGASWLGSCSHLTGARTPAAQSWEGRGPASRFIRNLVQGYRLAESDEDISVSGQSALF